MILIVVLTDYYTSSKYSPVHRIAESSQAGAGPTVITGLSVGLESVFISGLVIVTATLVSYLAVGWQEWATIADPRRGPLRDRASPRRACSPSRG